MKVKCSDCGKLLIRDIWAHLEYHDADTLYSYCPSCLNALLEDVRIGRQTACAHA